MDIGSQNSASQKTNVADNDILVEYLSVSFLHNTKNLGYFAGIGRTNRVNVELGVSIPVNLCNVPVCAIIRTWNWFLKSSDFGTYSRERQSYYLYSSLYQEANLQEVRQHISPGEDTIEN